MRITANPNLTQFRNAQTAYRSTLTMERDASKLRTATYTFEDTVNGLSGAFIDFPPAIQSELQLENYSLLLLAQDKGITLSLYAPLLPDVSQNTTVEQVVTRTGKQIYPKTITFSYVSRSTSSNVVAAPVSSPPILVPTVTDADIVDPIFDEIDAIPVTQEPQHRNFVDAEWAPMLSNALVELAMTAAANANGLQAGLTTFSHNPLSSLIEDMRDLLLFYTDNRYANLNVALSGIATNPSLNVEYKRLREAIGGPDGLSGCVAQLDAFKDHTDRLSGLTLAEDSPNAEPTDDSRTEYLNLYGLTGGPQIIFSFNARKFRSAKYLIQATAADADRGHQVNELYILHDGYHAYTREIAAMYSESPFVSFTTRLFGGNIEVYATTTADNTDFVIHGTRLQVSRAAQSYANVSQSKIIENHQTLENFLNDGVDYVRYQSESLYNAAVVGNIAREMRDMLRVLTTPSFLGSSLANQSAAVNAWSEIMTSRREAIQESIEQDYERFVECGKKSEALTIAYALAQGYESPLASNTLNSTLNSQTKAAIVAENDEE